MKTFVQPKKVLSVKKEAAETDSGEKSWPPDPTTCNEFYPDPVLSIDELNQDIYDRELLWQRSLQQLQEV